MKVEKATEDLTLRDDIEELKKKYCTNGKKNYGFLKLEKTIEDLTFRNDINKLSLEELKEKYCTNEKDYEFFLSKFASIFRGRYHYPLWIFSQYDKIESLIEGQNELKSENIQKLSSYILSSIERERTSPTAEDDRVESFCMFMQDLGINKMNDRFTSYEEIVENLLMYTAYLSGINATEISKDEVQGVLEYAVDRGLGTLSGDKRKIGSLVSSYFRMHPTVNLCYDPKFLITANYLMYHPSFECDESFLDLVKDVIDVTETIPLPCPEEIKPNYNKDEYDRIARITKKTIKEEEKKISPKKNQFLMKIKKMCGKNNNE